MHWVFYTQFHICDYFLIAAVRVGTIELLYSTSNHLYQSILTLQLHFLYE